MIKKISLLFLFLIMIPLSVHADVLIEPEDSFYKTHSEDCYSHKKYYTAQTNVTVHKNPNTSKAMDTAEAGSNFYIEWIYTAENGAEWGLYESRDFSYWVSMEHLQPVYSHDEFVDEHKSEILEIQEPVAIDQQGWITMHEYPGSEWISDVIKTEWIHDDSSLIVHSLYVDEQGKRWGYIPYYMQHNGWICLDDAVTKTEPVRNAPVIFIPENSPSLIPVVAILVISLCLLTAGVTWIIKRKENLH